MNAKFLIYALFVVGVSTVSSWVRLANTAKQGGGNSWVSHTGGGGGGYGGGYSGGGGGGHK